MTRAVIVTTEKHNTDELVDILTRDNRFDSLGAYKDPLELLQNVNDRQPDVIFIDFNLPGMNGLDLASRIREKNKKVIIVLMADAKDYALEAYSVGVSDYILKPFREQRIKKILERISVPTAI